MNYKDLIPYKGSAWHFDANYCTSAWRGYRQRHFSSNFGSFRIVLRKKTDE